MKRKSQREHSDKFLNAVEHNNEDDLDLILAVETLSAINQQDLHLPKYKSLRKLIFNLGFFLDGDFSKITQALELNMYDHVFYALSMMRSLDKNIKIGSVQRWVRLAALESDLGLRYRLLDAIIRTSDPDQISLTDNVEETHVQNHLRRLEPFAIPGNSEIITKVEKNWEFYLVETEKNFKDGSHLQILSHAPGSVNFENSGKIIKTDIPFIQNGFALSNVLSSNECAQLINAADSIGWIDNSGYSFTANVNKGAAGVVWLVDDSILNPIMERIKPFLPNVEKFAGINARFRFYKYSLGSEFRPHIDGSWPGSGFVNDNYAFDAYGDRWSFYTCLIYLNDASEFDGGETSFFWPSSKDGVLIKRGISPKSGAFLFFPHGNKALVHEGSAVTKGFKYVIRTDVLYYKS
jgi:hypothetical protein